MDYGEYLKTIPGPDNVILDLTRPMHAFLMAVKKMREFEVDPSETIERLMAYCNHEEYAVAALMQLCESIRDDHAMHGPPGVSDGEVMAKAVEELGQGLIDKLKEFRLYAPDGSLHYRFKCWATPSAPIVEKFAETDAFPNI